VKCHNCKEECGDDLFNAWFKANKSTDYIPVKICFKCCEEDK
jgi:hypothetical protein